MGALSVIPESFARVAQHEAEAAAAVTNMRELRRGSQMEEANAAAALQRGALAAGLARQRGSEVAGRARVAFAASGVDASSGTAAQVQATTAAVSGLDAALLRNNARREALGHREVARRYEVERERLEGRYGMHTGVTGSRADDELFGGLAVSALGAAASFGMGVDKPRKKGSE